MGHWGAETPAKDEPCYCQTKSPVGNGARMHPIACEIMRQRRIRRCCSIPGKGAVDHVIGPDILCEPRWGREDMGYVGLPHPRCTVHLCSCIDGTMLSHKIHEVVGVALKPKKCLVDNPMIIRKVVRQQRSTVAKLMEEGSP